MPWNAVEAEFGAELNQSQYFQMTEDAGKKRFDDFRKVVVEHVSLPTSSLLSNPHVPTRVCRCIRMRSWCG